MENIDLRKLSAGAQQQLRYQVIRLRKQGRSNKEISAITGVCYYTCSKWWSLYKKEGIKSLKIRRRGRRFGSCRRLNQEQEKEIQKALCCNLPNELGLPFYLWTRMAVQQLIKQRLGVEIPIRTIGEYLKRWHFTPQKPVYLRGERDDEEIERWKTKEFIKIRNAALKRKAYLVFIDETGFMLAPLRRRTYAPRGQTPVIKVLDPHGRISVIAAITVSPKRHRANIIFRLLPDNANFNSEKILQFLSHVHKRISKPLTIVWDSIPIHGSRAVTNFLDDASEIISEKFPIYAPEINPVDKIWGYIKFGRLANYAPFELSQLRSKVKEELMTIKKKEFLLHSFIKGSGLEL